MHGKSAHLRFYAELNEFLSPKRRGSTFDYEFWVEPSVKDVIESCGVPHTEVEVVLANSRSVGFEYRVRDGDRISVYPMFEAMDVTPILRLRPEPLRETRFILDTHLGRLARYLRMLGFDTAYRPDATDEELASVSAGERRILLTRDRGLLMRRAVTHGHYVSATAPREQLAEIVARYDLHSAIRPFIRCMRCNGMLEPAGKEQATARVSNSILERHDRFQRCPDCGRLYWEGSHHRRMLEFIEALLEHRYPEG